MKGSLIDSVLHICKILNKHSVEYLLVGSTAVALHGYFRLSHQSSGQLTEKHDLDFDIIQVIGIALSFMMPWKRGLSRDYRPFAAGIVLDP